MRRRTGLSRAQLTKKYNARRAKAPTPTFKKQVLSVVNKIAEKKKFNQTITYTLGIPNNTLATWNLLNSLGQGTNTAQRIGDKIYITSIRVGLEMFNGASVTVNDTVNFRVILFRGKYDYSTTNYPINEVLENNAGAAPFHATNAPVDLNQVTPLYDKVFQLTNNYTGQRIRKNLTFTLPIKKTFNFREDDNFAKTSNLYLGVYQTSQAGSAVDVFGNIQTRFTDV